MLRQISKTLLFLTLFFLQAYLIRFKIGPYPSNLQEIMIGTLTVLTLLSYKPSLKRIFKEHYLIIIIGILAISSTLTVQIFSTIDLIRYWKFLIFGALLVYAFFENLRSSQDREKGLYVLGLGACAFGVLSIAYNLFEASGDSRLVGPLDAAVYLAYYLTPFLIYFFIKVIEKKDAPPLVLLIFLAFLVFATKSMGAIAGSFIIIAIYLFKKYGKSFLNSYVKKIIFSLVFLILIGAIFYTKILPTINTTWSSIDERQEIWMTAGHLLKEPTTFIYGTGFGQFQYQYENNVVEAINNNPLDFYVLQPHNIFLFFWLNFGILGLAFFLYLIYLSLHTLIKSRKIDLPLISTLILLYFFTHGMLDTPFFKNDLIFLFLLFMGLSISSPKQDP